MSFFSLVQRSQRLSFSVRVMGLAMTVWLCAYPLLFADSSSGGGALSCEFVLENVGAQAAKGVGRKNELGELEVLVDQRKNIAIFGAQGIGKSTLIELLAARLQNRASPASGVRSEALVQVHRIQWREIVADVNSKLTPGEDRVSALSKLEKQIVEMNKKEEGAGVSADKRTVHYLWIEDAGDLFESGPEGDGSARGLVAAKIRKMLQSSNVRVIAESEFQTKPAAWAQFDPFYIDALKPGDIATGARELARRMELETGVSVSPRTLAQVQALAKSRLPFMGELDAVGQILETWAHSRKRLEAGKAEHPKLQELDERLEAAEERLLEVLGASAPENQHAVQPLEAEVQRLLLEKEALNAQLKGEREKLVEIRRVEAEIAKLSKTDFGALAAKQARLAELTGELSGVQKDSPLLPYGDVSLEVGVVADQLAKRRDPKAFRVSEERKLGVENAAPYRWEKATVDLDRVAGLDQVKKIIDEEIIAPSVHADLAAGLDLNPYASLIMFGPPGNGKTYIVGAIAKALGAERFLQTSAGELLSSWQGQSEKNAREFFRVVEEEGARAKANGKTLMIFLDEIEEVGKNRNSDPMGGGTLARVTNTFLENLQSLRAKGLPIVIVGATNKPWSLDPAFTRPGRFDRMLFVPLPDASAREQNLRFKLQDNKHLSWKLAGDVDLRKIAERLEGWSQADIGEGLYKQIQRLLLQKGIAARKGGVEIEKTITQADIDRAIELQLAERGPSVTNNEYQQYVDYDLELRGQKKRSSEGDSRNAPEVESKIPKASVVDLEKLKLESNEQPVVVVYRQPGCAHCEAMRPVFESMMERLKGAKMVEVNVAEARERFVEWMKTLPKPIEGQKAPEPEKPSWLQHILALQVKAPVEGDKAPQEQFVSPTVQILHAGHEIGVFRGERPAPEFEAFMGTVMSKVTGVRIEPETGSLQAPPAVP